MCKWGSWGRANSRMRKGRTGGRLIHGVIHYRLGSLRNLFCFRILSPNCYSKIMEVSYSSFAIIVDPKATHFSIQSIMLLATIFFTLALITAKPTDNRRER